MYSEFRLVRYVAKSRRLLDEGQLQPSDSEFDAGAEAGRRLGIEYLSMVPANRGDKGLIQVRIGRSCPENAYQGPKKPASDSTMTVSE